MYDEFQTQQFWDNMKKSQLKQLIKEEFNKILNEENTKVSFEDICKYAEIEPESEPTNLTGIDKLSNFEKIKDELNMATNNEINSMDDLVGKVAWEMDPTGYRMNKDKAEEEAKERITDVVNKNPNMVNLILNMEPQIGDIVPYEKQEWEIIGTSEKGGSKQFRLQNGSDKTWVTADMIKRSKNNQ